MKLFEQVEGQLYGESIEKILDSRNLTVERLMYPDYIRREIRHTPMKNKIGNMHSDHLFEVTRDISVLFNGT